MSTLPPDDLDRRILREEGGLLVVDKPPGLPTSGGSLDDPDCLQHAVIERHGAMVWAVHQLDADTSGANLFTTDRSLVAPLKEGLAAPATTKRYLAVVYGAPEWSEQTCEAPIGPVDERSLGVTDSGRAARTRLTVLGRVEGHALLAVEIETGRTHQIRIHAAHLGHPLVGEEWYRTPPCTLHPRQALHAWRLRLAGTIPLDVTAPVPDDLSGLFERLGLAAPDPDGGSHGVGTFEPHRAVPSERTRS